MRLKKVSLAHAVIITWSAIAIVALVIGAVKLMPDWTPSDTDPPEGMAGATPSAAPTPQGEQYVATVMDLLSRTLQAMQQGQPSTVTPDSVALQYGSSSQIFYAYMRGRSG